jgi:glutathione S-transferase
VIVVEHVLGCGGAPMLMFALEELGLPYERVVRESGYFLASYGEAGPLLRSGGTVHVGIIAALVSLATPEERAHIEPFARRIQHALRALASDRGDVPARRAIEGALDDLALSLGDRRYLLDTPSLADVTVLALTVLPKAGIDVARWPALSAWLERITSRTAWVRARARAAAPVDADAQGYAAISAPIIASVP